MAKRKLVFEATSVLISLTLVILGFIFSTHAESEPWYVITLFGLAFFIGGFAKAKSGMKKVFKNKHLNVSVLMIVAGLGAFTIGAYNEGAVLILIFSISGMLETYVSSKSDKALTSLLELAPETALLTKDGVEKEISVSQLKINDCVIVKVGHQVPVDGIVTQGFTSLNQAAITGEFLPVSKKKNDSVYAGSINMESTIIVKTTVDPAKSLVKKIVLFVEQALKNKSKSQTFIDKFGKHYVHFIVFLAIFYMIVPPLLGTIETTTAIHRGIIILVVGSPCALVASIAPPMLSALSNSAKKGILIKGGSHLENLKGVKTIIIDKTGTLTTGVPNIAHIESLASIDRNKFLSVLYTLEKQSSHPLAKAISDSMDAKLLLSSVRTKEVPGKGMEATIDNSNWKVGKFGSTVNPELQVQLTKWEKSGHSTISVTKDDKLIGFVALKDTIRDDAKLVVSQLKKQNIKTVLLTGDNVYSAASIANQSGIDEYRANCLPEDKVKYIKDLQQNNEKIMMIGDGINDAPALAIADISVSMGSGSDISLETSDIVFMNNKLQNIPKLLKLAKRMRMITLQNIVFSISVISILLFVTMSDLFGIDLPKGVIAHETSTIIVILNSLRLLFK